MFDENDLILVRIVDGLPNINEFGQAVLKPVGDSTYLRPMQLSSNRLINAISELSKKYETYENLYYVDEEEENLIIENNRKKRNKYIPLMGVTNCFQNFSVNGIVPDDINNCFSKKKIAIIDKLMFHLSKVIGLNAMDGTLEGDIEISSNGVVLISNDIVSTFNNDYLARLSESCKVKYFEGDIKDAIKDIFLELGYPFLEISKYGYETDDGKEFQNILDKLCTEKGISSSKNYYLLDLPKESSDLHIVYQYYAINFFDYLKEYTNGKICVEGDVLDYFLGQDNYFLVSSFEERDMFIKMIENYCLENGHVNIEKYKEIVYNYNSYLISLQKSGDLLTPNQIISQYYSIKKC